MIETETDALRNLFIIRYHSHVTAQETRARIEPMKLALDKMRAGFGILVDFSDLTTMDADCAPHIREIMDHANARPVKAVVRVIPDPHRDIGMQIMSRFHYGQQVQIATATTVSEAMKMLFD
jgi:anti-anti-sigma regulatory factor